MAKIKHNKKTMEIKDNFYTCIFKMVVCVLRVGGSECKGLAQISSEHVELTSNSLNNWPKIRCENLFLFPV